MLFASNGLVLLLCFSGVQERVSYGSSEQINGYIFVQKRNKAYALLHHNADSFLVQCKSCIFQDSYHCATIVTDEISHQGCLSELNLARLSKYNLVNMTSPVGHICIRY